MKNFLFSLLAATALAGATNTTQAQGLNTVSMNDSKGHHLTIDESVLPGDATTSSNTSFVTIKALKDFKKFFKNASNASWEKSAEGFVAKFSEGSIQNIIYYDKKGNWQASMKSYGEDMLDKDIRTLVKRAYFDDQITYVNEVNTTSTEGVPTYVIHLEGAHDIKLVRVQNGEMDVIQDYNKQ